ncbi:MAG: hypothetical protein ABIH65_03025 [Nanoarchaeota archaeon]
MINQIMNIYSVKLTFKKNSRIVIVEIRDAKKGKIRKKRLPIPEEISVGELHWIKYQKDIISIYHRKIRDDQYIYRNSRYMVAPISLSQRLEKLVSNFYCKFYSD